MYGNEPVTSKPKDVTVAISRCADYEPAAVRRALLEGLGHLGGLEAYIKSGESVLIKPNFIAPLPRQRAAQTDPEMIVQLALLLKELGARPFVGDSPAWGTVFDCAAALELTESLKKLDVPVRQLNKPRWIRVQPSGAKVGISGIALDADRIINLPKLKSHRQLGATIAVKNMFGCVSGKAKPFWHYARGGSERKFAELLIGVYNAAPPVLNIIDAVTAMEAGGPINGKARDIGLVIASTNPFACELVCAAMMAISENDLPVLRTARELGLCDFGCEDIRTLGARLEDCLCPDFVHLDRIPIKFTFGRVCKSIGKQLIRLAAGAVSRREIGK